MKANSNSVDATTWILLLSLALLWGGSFIFVELALWDMPPLTIVALRVLLGAVMLHLVLRYKNLSFPFDLKSIMQFAMMGALNNAIPFTLIVWGQQTIDAGRASILNATVPFFTVVIAHFVFSDEKLNTTKLIGIIAGFIGVMVLAGPSALGTEEAGATIGQLAVLGAAISYAFAAIFGRKLNRFEPLVAACGMLTASAVIMLPIAILVESAALVRPGLISVASVVALGVACTAVAYILYFSILTRAGSGNLSLVTFLIPPGAMLMGVLFLQETVSLNEILGLLFILIGMSFATGLHQRLFSKGA